MFTTVTTTALPVGTHSITAVYGGDGAFDPGVSAPDPWRDERELIRRGQLHQRTGHPELVGSVLMKRTPPSIILSSWADTGLIQRIQSMWPKSRLPGSGDGTGVRCGRLGKWPLHRSESHGGRPAPPRTWPSRRGVRPWDGIVGGTTALRRGPARLRVSESPSSGAPRARSSLTAVPAQRRRAQTSPPKPGPPDS